MTKTEGFTLVEIIITVVVVGVLVGPILGTLTAYYIESVRSDVETKLLTASNEAIRSVADQTKLASGVRSMSALNDSNAPSGGWTTDVSKQRIILTSPALDSSSTIINGPDGKPYQNEFIYYVTASNLYRRTIKNTTASANTAVTTCPPASTTPGCPPDAQLAKNVSSFTYILKQRSEAPAPTPEAADLVTFTLTLGRQFMNKTITATESSSLVFRNKVSS